MIVNVQPYVSTSFTYYTQFQFSKDTNSWYIYVAWVAVFLAVIHGSLSVWVSITLGKMSTGVEITTKEQHYVVSKGFYSIIRHPYYFLHFFNSILFLLMCGNWLIALAFALQHYFLISRYKEEEQYLMTELGEEYVTYMQRVPNALNPIPGLKRILFKSQDTADFIPLQTMNEDSQTPDA